MKAARRVVTRSPHRSVGRIACSWLQEQSIEYESQLERRFLHQALLLTGLTKILHQPFRVSYALDGNQHEYTPDFLLGFSDGSKIVVEVKPAEFVNKHKVKLDAAAAFFGIQGIPFFVVTDKQIDVEFTAVNASLLLRYARGSISAETQCRCIQAINHSPKPLTLGELVVHADVPLIDVYHLIGRGILKVSLHRDLNSASVITTSRSGEQNGLLCFCNWFDVAPWRATA